MDGVARQGEGSGEAPRQGEAAAQGWEAAPRPSPTRISHWHRRKERRRHAAIARSSVQDSSLQVAGARLPWAAAAPPRRLAATAAVMGNSQSAEARTRILNLGSGKAEGRQWHLTQWH